MNQLEVVLISGRTAEQGAGLEVGKTSERYFKSVAALELSINDADELGLEDGDPVDLANQAEVSAYGAFKDAHFGKIPASRQSLRAWTTTRDKRENSKG